jgi:hypothetical protein
MPITMTTITNRMTTSMNTSIEMRVPYIRHSGGSRNPISAKKIPAFAGMTQ